jgi:hypothetical protein
MKNPENTACVVGTTNRTQALAATLGLILAAPNAMAASKIVVDFPALGEGDLSRDIYVYQCTDATCTATTQLEEYGRVTNVHRWPKGAGGPGGPPPAIWTFLPVVENVAQYFEFWQSFKGSWQSCVLGVTADGGLDNGTTTCVGVVATPPKAPDGVPQFSMGAAMFSQAASRSDPNPEQENRLPERGLTFINDTSAAAICLQTDSSFAHQNCSGEGATLIAQGDSYAIDASALQDGYNSGIAQVMGYQLQKGGSWTYTGRDGAGNVYATNLEWTVWPEQDDHTPGPTTIDVSLVNGFNAGVDLVPDRDTVCSVADSEGGVPYFVMYRAGVPMASFPDRPTAHEQACPADNEITDSTGAKTGCYSACTYAVVTGQQVDEMCCRGDYNTAASCTLPPTTAYVQDIDAHSERVYSWAFQDYRGTFTCEPSAKFSFRVFNPPLPARG